jgi:hypothetical protein
MASDTLCFSQNHEKTYNNTFGSLKEVNDMLLTHAFRMFTHPKAEWDAIRKENSSASRVYITYAGILALITPICAFISTSWFGWEVTEGRVIKLTTSSSLQLNILTYGAMLFGVFALGWMIDWMSKTYGGNQDESATQGIALTAYACTPLFLAGFALLYPVPWFNMIIFLAAAAYSGYLIYNGIPILMGIDKDRAVMFGGAILTVALVMLVSTRVGSVIIWSLGVGPEYVSG